jgi:hypothetical protein
MTTIYNIVAKEQKLDSIEDAVHFWYVLDISKFEVIYFR